MLLFKIKAVEQKTENCIFFVIISRTVNDFLKLRSSSNSQLLSYLTNFVEYTVSEKAIMVSAKNVLINDKRENGLFGFSKNFHTAVVFEHQFYQFRVQKLHTATLH